MKYKAFDSSHFHGKSHFEDDAAHNYLVFQPVHRYFKTVANTSEVSVWKSKWLSNQNIKPSSKSGYITNLSLNYFNNSTR